ncbi:MAG: HXXEE domain-containing protein [Oscillospiraceae bacterium]|nr:HXXEE domain-containing protein [Oscillospiraceae bacterium]
MKRKLTALWLSCWLYVITLISGIINGCILSEWAVWDTQTKLFAAATALLPLHVLEEWRFPGGFHTMYNLMKGSDAPDRYPMNQLSDMWTNFIGVIFGCAVLLTGVRAVFLIMQLFLCCAEMLGHFSGGIYALRRFKDKGKNTIYNPGLFTTVFGYVPIAVGIVLCLFTTSRPAPWTLPAALLCSVLLGAFSLRGVEKLCKSRDTPYGYTWGNGYFEKYLKQGG